MSVIFESDATDLAAEGFADEVMERFRGLIEWKTGGADIGKTIAVGIGGIGTGIVNEIGTEAVGRSESGSLAEEDQGEPAAEKRADFVFECDATEGDNADRAEGET